MKGGLNMAEDYVPLLKGVIGSLQSSSISEADRFAVELILTRKLILDRKDMLRKEGIPLSNTYMQRLLLLSSAVELLIQCLSSGLQGMDQQEWLGHVSYVKEQSKLLGLGG